MPTVSIRAYRKDTGPNQNFPAQDSTAGRHGQSKGAVAPGDGGRCSPNLTTRPGRCELGTSNMDTTVGGGSKDRLFALNHPNAFGVSPLYSPSTSHL
jgi:hypothetical protein